MKKYQYTHKNGKLSEHHFTNKGKYLGYWENGKKQEKRGTDFTEKLVKECGFKLK